MHQSKWQRRMENILDVVNIFLWILAIINNGNSAFFWAVLVTVFIQFNKWLFCR